MTLKERWQALWGLWSVRLAVVAGFVSGWAATDPHGFAQLMDSIPAPLRPFVGLLVAFSAIYARAAKQGGKSSG